MKLRRTLKTRSRNKKKIAEAEAVFRREATSCLACWEDEDGGVKRWGKAWIAEVEMGTKRSWGR